MTIFVFPSWWNTAFRNGKGISGGKLGAPAVPSSYKMSKLLFMHSGGYSTRMFTVNLAGATGYAGGEFLRLIACHPQFTPGVLSAGSSRGSLRKYHPHLRSYAKYDVVETSTARLAEGDVVVLALPHGASGQLAQEIAEINPDAILVDLGADHRLESEQAWNAFYGGTYRSAWTYGMPELLRRDKGDELPNAEALPTEGPLSAKEEEAFPGGVVFPSRGEDAFSTNSGGEAASTTGSATAVIAAARAQRAALATTRRIAGPGCNASAMIFAIQPALAAGLVSGEDMVATLAVGYSGAGKNPAPHLLAAEALESASAYNIAGRHRHIPEIQEKLGYVAAPETTFSLSMTPILVPMARGILACVSLPVRPGTTGEHVRDAYQAAYTGEPFVQWSEDLPTTAAVYGSNTALVHAELDRSGERMTVICALDNLVKGTAGAAIQSLNLALGLPETLGLPGNGVTP
ncbi:hypothetical protein ACU20_05415 [Actinobaculum suis]|nr:hypothetical protein ACU20_05415 [Actinobaculum suis]